MKKIFKYACFGLIGCMTLTSCLESSLETTPTDSMSGTGLLANANAALVPLNGVYRSMYASWSPAGNTHQSFGISSYNLMADVMGDDFIQAAMGSGWFWYDCLYMVKDRYTSTSWRSYDLWNAYYTWVSNANYILDAEETMEGEEADVNYVIGQAYAIRAYSYFMLAQSFARTYKGHESEPCCPIYTEPTVAGTQGKPRATVQEVYDQITADMDKAAQGIILGGAYDNNLLCIGEKEVFVVESVFNRFMEAMTRAGAFKLTDSQVERLTSEAFVPAGGNSTHKVVNRNLVGRDAAILAKTAGTSVPEGTQMLFAETDSSHIFVQEEQMMPFIPIVKVRDVEEGIEKSLEAEHNYKHTAIIHSYNVNHMTAMARALDTTIFVKNGPSVCGLGNGGEGYSSFSIATPTGEGITTPRTFTRIRRCVMVDNLRIY